TCCKRKARGDLIAGFCFLPTRLNLKRHLEAESIISGLHIVRCLTQDGFIIERNMHMRENGALGRQLLNPFERFAEGEMAWVRAVLQCIDYKDIGSAQIVEALLGKRAHIGAIDHRTNAKPERLDIAVHLAEWLKTNCTAGPRY